MLDCALAFLIAFAAAVPGAAQSADSVIPVNASMQVYGDGWECDLGYRRVEANCLAVEVSQNAHLECSGHDWDCNEPGIKRRLTCTSGNLDD